MQQPKLGVPERRWSPFGIALLTLIASSAAIYSCRDATEPSVSSEQTQPVARSTDPTTLGEWSPVFDWPVVAIHLHLLPTGKVLSFGRMRAGVPQLWDPTTNKFTPKPVGRDIFCAGHVFLPDGRLFVAGGRGDHDVEGIKDVNIFNPFTEEWESAPPMNYARWYPTATLLPNGEVAVVAGTDENKVHVEIPEVWTGSGWRRW